MGLVESRGLIANGALWEVMKVIQLFRLGLRGSEAMRAVTDGASNAFNVGIGYAFY